MLFNELYFEIEGVDQNQTPFLVLKKIKPSNMQMMQYFCLYSITKFF
jgi:hypothetical protein